MMEIFKCHIAIRASAVKKWFDEIGKRFVFVFGECSEDGNSIAVIFLHHGSDSIDKDAELLYDSLIDIQILRPFQRIQCLVVVSIFYLYLGDLVDGASDCPLVCVVLDCLFITNDRVIGST